MKPCTKEACTHPSDHAVVSRIVREDQLVAHLGGYRVGRKLKTLLADSDGNILGGSLGGQPGGDGETCGELHDDWSRYWLWAIALKMAEGERGSLRELMRLAEDVSSRGMAI
jgi:hypothetical protein